jgi:hypothetical protein
MKVRIAGIGILLAMLAGQAFGQATNSADVTGTVTDSSSALLPGVSVVVKDIDKGITRTYVTNAAGVYDTGPLFADDHYTLTFTRGGFAPLQRGPMMLSVGRIGLDAQLSVGQTSQQVEVTTDAPLLETATPELSTSLQTETLQVLPQIGAPDWQQNIILQPGTVGNAGNSATPGMGGVSSNGSLPYSSFLVDGGMSNSTVADNVIIIPVFDAVAEIKMINSLASAQYPTGGILYNEISKGGTNTIHGMAYDYLQNTMFNAANYAFGTPHTPAVSPIHFNDFGFNLGGPVLRNRLFLFFDWDHTINNGLGALSFATVPTAAERAGDFTGQGTIYDPTTQTVVGTTLTRQSFASEYGSNKIPANLISPVAKAIQAYFPAPNVPGVPVGGTNNYSYQVPSNNVTQKYFGRVDVDLTKSNRITGSASENLNKTLSASPICPINCTNFGTSNITSQLSDYWTISQNTLNEARISLYGEYDALISSSLNLGYPTKLGLKFAKSDIFPSIAITNFYGLGPGIYFIDKENMFDLSDSVTLIRGRHSIQIGGQAVIERDDAVQFNAISAASLAFTGAYTGNDASHSGLAYSDFLLGYSRSWSAFNYPEYGARKKEWAGFVQDDWKVTRKLVLNLGLRYDGRIGWREVQGNLRTFDPTIVNPATNTLGAMWYQSTHTNGRTAAEAPRINNWYPRIGAAYQLNSKTSIRGGFGIYSYQWNYNWEFPGIGQARGSNGSEADATNNISPVVTLDNDGSTNFQGSKGSSINALYKAAPTAPDAYNGQPVAAQLYHWPVSKLSGWNLDVQRQLSSRILGEIAYVGSHGSNLVFLTDLNQVPESLLSPTDVGSRPYPQFQTITTQEPWSVSNYHALQASASSRMSHGLTFNGNYTWSHFLSTLDSSGWNGQQGTQIWQNAYKPSANYGASNFDVRHAVKGSVVYQLPFGKNGMFFRNSGQLDRVIGGWTASGTVNVQSGHPFTPIMTINNSFAQSSNMTWFPNQVGSPKLANRGINGWFNVAAFQAPTAGSFGNTRRNSVYGPGLSEVNMSVHKRFAITERVSFDFSGNATNVLNHPSFGLPDPAIAAGHTATIRSTTVGGRSMEFVGKIAF